MDPDDVADHVAIAELKNAYCHRIDSGDYEGWVDLFTEDGVFDAGEAFEGHEALLSFAEDVFDEQYGRTAHVVSTPVVDVDGDRATGRFYLHFLYEDADGNTGWRQSRYEDEFRREDGDWKIATVTIQRGISG